MLISVRAWLSIACLNPKVLIRNAADRDFHGIFSSFLGHIRFNIYT